MCLATCASGEATPAQTVPTLTTDVAETNAMILEPVGDVTHVHDPVMIKDGDMYYLFSTGLGISVRRSTDMLTWESCGRVFRTYPSWLLETVPDVRELWAPDIIFHNGKYYLFYTASSFGVNHSAIGLATNITLDQESPGYEWVDQGVVIASQKSDNYNAIDPNLAFDENGQPWLAFGSFWSGIKLIEIDPQTFKPTPDAELIAIAARPDNTAIEGAFITHRGDYYYLFVSHDFCCRGINSNYKIMVGRSKNITGPYVDSGGRPMMEGGGNQVYAGSDRWRGPGHNSIFIEDDTYWMVYHSYDAEAEGIPTLHIEALKWDSYRWPLSPSAQLGK
ncbi:MAG: arabinan endo-1,5-alpha-L-arabinosidase [Anaerolineae bacterium]|nr:arabinan endo-1,5-alpha-L-arabinosidase [Anaerolineae bacterium]